MIKPSTLPVKTEPPISKTANACGGSACIRATRIPVWSLVLWHRQGVTDARLLEMYPTLSQVDLNAAWLYDASHRDEIDQDIMSNEDPTQVEAGKNLADEDIRSGRVKTFEKPEDLIASLKKPW